MRIFWFVLIVFLFMAAMSETLDGQSVIKGINWFPIGPADISNGQTYGDSRVNVSGRATVIAVNPNNANELWVGTASGGSGIPPTRV